MADVTDGWGGSGGDALAGYDYQVDVSVWLALDLVLTSKLTNELVLEPASQEDIESDLQEFEPGRITSELPMGAYRLVVQAKLRTGDAWTVAGIKALLKHGSDKRVSAASRLQNSKIRYLLITSAALNGLTRKLKVLRAGVWPKAGSLPKLVAEALPADAAGRVAIIGNLDPEILSYKIKQLLTESFRVPNANVNACHKQLREEARVRICGAGSGRWDRAQLESLVQQHEGYIASSPELEHYIHPTNWHELRSAMEKRHAAIIIGQSGTGKTLATKKLFDELCQEIPGLAHVQISHGPQQLRNDHTPSPVLYDIEDPWGRFNFDPDSRPWNDQLSRMLADARSDRLIIATSRYDVAQSADVFKDIEPWVVRLEAEHYGKHERRRLYQTRIAKLPRELQLIAQKNEKVVLDELATPLEIQKFFDALPTLDRQDLPNSGKFIQEAIAKAHQQSIERTVIEQINERDDVRAAATIWALLKANDKLSLSALRVIENGLCERDQNFLKGVEPLISFFVAARNLRQSGEIISYYHPRVESGIQQTLLEHRLLTCNTLQHLINTLISPDGPGEEWGVQAATKIVSATKRHEAIRPNLRAEAQAKIDAWLANTLLATSSDFEEMLALAASAGSTKSKVSEVARYLMHRSSNDFFGMSTWRAPEHDDAWYTSISNDPATKPVIEAFIRKILPNTRDDYDIDFVIDIERLASDLSDAFLDAAINMVHYGYSGTCETIAEGALKNLDKFEEVVDRAVKVLTPSDLELTKDEETRLALINDEYSVEYAEYLSDNDDGYTAYEFLESYVAKAREILGWRALEQHRHLSKLRRHWLRILSHENSKSLPGEIFAILNNAYNTDDEADLWFVISKFWNIQFANQLTTRLIQSHPSATVRLSALTCLIENIPNQTKVLIDQLLANEDWSRLTEISIELSLLCSKKTSHDGKDHSHATKLANTHLPERYQEISEVAFTLHNKGEPSLTHDTQEFLVNLEKVSSEIREFRVLVDRHIPLQIEDDIRWLLAHSDDPNVAFEAAEAAVRHAMHAEIKAALNHRFACVCALALEAIATPLLAPLPEQLLALAHKKGCGIRKTLVKLLDDKPHIDHLPTLLVLAQDKWSNGRYMNHENESLPIAQEAVSAIGKLGTMSIHTAEELWNIAIESNDPELRFSIFKLLSEIGSLDTQQRLFDLAIAPGRRSIRRAASRALLLGSQGLAPELISQITLPIIISKPAGIASDLLLLHALKGEAGATEEVGKMLAATAERRVFVLLLIWVLKENHEALTKRLAAMLPNNHSAVQWILGEVTTQETDLAFDDLGSPEAVSAVRAYLLPENIS